MTELHACPECHRHVRVDARRCPFCDAPCAPAPARRPATSSRTLTRAAIFAGVTLIAPACVVGEEPNGGNDQDGTSGGTQQQPVVGQDQGNGSQQQQQQQSAATDAGTQQPPDTGIPVAPPYGAPAYDGERLV